MKNKAKICLVTSGGGHLLQIYLLQPWWCRFDRFWIAEPGSDTDSLLGRERFYYAHTPTVRNPANAVLNFFLALKIFKREAPALVISCGAGVAPPVLLAGKVLGIKTVFIDSVTFVRYPSLSARLCSLFTDTILTQHKSITTKLRRAKYWGGIL